MSAINQIRLETQELPSEANKTSNWKAIAIVINTIVAGTILGLGIALVFGPVGSPGFIASLTGGGVTLLISMAIFGTKACSKPKSNPPLNQPEDVIAAPVQEIPFNSNPQVSKSVDKQGAPTAPVIPAFTSTNIHSISQQEVIQPTNAAPVASASSNLSSLTDDQVIKNLNAAFKTSDIYQALKNLPNDFFSVKSGDRAKKMFSAAMMELLQEEVAFPRSGPLENPEQYVGVLDEQTFQIATTKGVEKDIPKACLDQQNIHVFQVASQFNAAEAPDTFTPAVGMAMRMSDYDDTQGPKAQRTNPVAFELVTAFLTHLGFNMLAESLPSAGQTHDKGGLIEHGYLRPTDATIAKLTEEMKLNYAKSQFVCYSTRVGKALSPAYLFLQSTPAIGYAYNLKDKPSSKELQNYVFLANFLAFFRHGIHLAKEKKMPVILHVAALGLGAFRNDPSCFKWGFEKAALALQDEMKQAKVLVQLDDFKGTSPLGSIASQLGIPTVIKQ